VIGRACNKNLEKEIAFRILMGKPEGKRPLGRQRSRRVDNNGPIFARED
jgi:hypothetical protein